VSRPVVAFITDFGDADPFVGVMKGVVLSRCPDAALVDVTHGIPPQAVGEAAFWLAKTFAFFPAGTVFVAVVDPGVGTERRAAVLAAHGRLFVGPDNGVLSSVVDDAAPLDAFEIDIGQLGLPEPSRTFQGRDVFAPLAAELAAGRLAKEGVGPRLASLAPPVVPRAARTASGVAGTVVTVDRFGNLITNVEAADLPGRATRVLLDGVALPLGRSYADAAVGAAIALVNAWGVVEIAVRDGDASRALGKGRGAAVSVR
jgi:S-adenosylmethionine hydrolase